MPNPPEVRRSAGRPASDHAPGVRALHSFSFGAHYDPANLGFGPIVCHDDHLLAAGHGYADHPHSDLEIVTWVLEGALVHTSTSAGAASGTVPAGGVQVLSAGAGVVHSETGAPDAGPTRFVQTWLRPDVPGAVPSYAADPGAADPSTGPSAGGLAPVAGAGAALPVATAGATLWVGRAPGPVVLPEAPLLHVFCATGAADLEDGPGLADGDACRLTDSGGRRLVLHPGSELLVWSFAR